jgi:prepilin-type N-terminal cleavage/methylation domain-containing protein
MNGLRQRGFSILELAVVIAIVGFLAFLIAPILSSTIGYSRLRETKAKMEPVKSAIVAFVSANNRLPCPAVESLPSSNAAYGREAATPGTCTGTTALTGGAVRGVLPWVALGLPAEAATDAHGRFLTYIVTATQTNLTTNTLPGMTGAIAVHNATPVAAGNQINTGNLAVAAVISHGTNGAGGFNPESGARTPLPGGTDELENTDTANAAIIDKGLSDTPANPFDDIVLWITPSDLLAQLASSGVKTPQGAMQEKLQAIRAALLSYVAADTADPDGAGARTKGRRLPCADTDGNGSGDCPTRIGTVPYTELSISSLTATDPWGRLIRYNVSDPNLLSFMSNGVAGIHSGTSGLLTVILSSDGPDGVAGNADDLSLTSTVSELRGALVAAGLQID